MIQYDLDLTNESRNLARAASVHLREDPLILEHVIRWAGAFPYAVKNVLRDTEGLGPIADDLPKAELDWVLRAEHPPLAIARRITEEIGVEIVDPFGHDLNDLALEDLCAKIAKNLLALTGRHDEADAHQIETGETIKIGVE
jgi:predicted membrane chloride channel (bestrophin family)